MPRSCLAFVILISSALAVCGSEFKRMHETAAPLNRPAGAPRAGDVIMRTLRFHPTRTTDKHDTLQAIADFHVTRLAWSYVNDKNLVDKVKAASCTFGGAASAPSYLPRPEDSDWFEKVVIVDAAGRPIIAPWKRTWKRTLWGCVNNPEYERGYLEYLKRYVDAGADVMQRDEPRANLLAVNWGGCFCGHCMRGFRGYLEQKTTAAQRQELGIADSKTFDYVRDRKVPIGDAFGRYRGGRLKELFVAFQTEATLAFHRRTRQAINAYAKRRLPVSCNNGARRCDAVELEFDWWFGELSYGHARPERLYSLMRTAREHGRVQIVTMPKKGDYNDVEAWQQRTRQSIATAYACGGLSMVPWDVYMPRDAPRYFGTPEQYADLYGFVRAMAEYLNGYQHAAACGPGLEDTVSGGEPLRVEGGSGRVYAFARTVPESASAPVVVHLVDWADQPAAFQLELRRAQLFGNKPTTAALWVPPAYDAATHAHATRGVNYSKLRKRVECPTIEGDGTIRIQIPPLKPWGVIVISPVE